MTATSPMYSRMHPDAAASFLRVDPCAPSAYENSSSWKGNTSYPHPSPSPSPTCSNRLRSSFFSSTENPFRLCSTALMTFSSAPRLLLRLPRIMSFSTPSSAPLVGLPKNMSVPYSSSMFRSTIPFLPITYATQSSGTLTMDRSSLRGPLVSTVMGPTRWRSTHCTYCFAFRLFSSLPKISSRCFPSSASSKSSLAPATLATLSLVLPPVPTRKAASSAPMIISIGGFLRGFFSFLGSSLRGLRSRGGVRRLGGDGSESPSVRRGRRSSSSDSESASIVG
mmetsp:Transcript_10278/g.42500  ORF Transcript_10278/g.42500 Transcript_10278/m.42500 type:complete len:280 (+) Transcript_10278:364-1203(+)